MQLVFLTEAEREILVETVRGKVSKDQLDRIKTSARGTTPSFCLESLIVSETTLCDVYKLHEVLCSQCSWRLFAQPTHRNADMNSFAKYSTLLCDKKGMRFRRRSPQD